MAVPNTIPRPRNILLCVFVAVTSAMIACSDLPLTAPTDSRIELTMAPSVLAADGDPGQVTVLVTEKDGVLVEDGTQVVLIATGGELCEPTNADQCEWRSIVTRSTTSGVATAIVRSGRGTTLNVLARSGAISGTKDFVISGVVAPGGSKVLLTSDPDTIAAGGSAQVHAFVSSADGTPVADYTRVVFQASGATVTRPIALTRDGFASTTVTAKADSTPQVTFRSGPVTATLTIPVKQ